MTQVSYGRGILRATVVAGPTFLGSVGLLELAARIEPVTGITVQGLAGGAVVLLLTMPVGAILSVVPVLIGTTVLAHLGRGNDAVRLPAFWGVVGAVSIAVPLAAMGPDMPAIVAAAFVATAVVVALVARSGVHWHPGERSDPWRRPAVIG